MVAPAYSRLVQDEGGVVAPLTEESSTESGALDPLQPLRRDDLVGVDVGSLEGNRATFEDAYRIHAGTSSGEAKRPMIAVAAATTGETK